MVRELHKNVSENILSGYCIILPNNVISARGDETICYRGRICQLPLSKRAAQVFSHSMKPVKNEKHCSSTESWSRLNASRAAHSSSLAYTISCKNVQILNHEDKRWPFAYHFEKIES